MQTPPISIVFFVLASVLGALGQYLYKTGAAQLDATLVSLIFNARLWSGVACYIAVMVLFVGAYKRGGAMSVLYPVYATTFVWGALISLAVYGTPIKPVNVAGMSMLLVGMFLMGR